MRSQLPSLYRSLEKRASANAYDAIAMAAALNFLSISTPSSQQANAFSQLIEPLWRHLEAETRETIRARLEGHPNLPARIAELIDGTSPIKISQEDRSSADTRPAPSVSLSDMALLADRRDSETEPSRRAGSAKEARDTLRALVGAPAPSASTAHPVIEFARRKDHTGLVGYLSRHLDLSRHDCAELLEPGHVSALSAALKALGLSTADAMTVLLFTNATIARDNTAFAAARDEYELMPPAPRFAASSRATRPVHHPLAADLDWPANFGPQPRPIFGRRLAGRKPAASTGTGH